VAWSWEFGDGGTSTAQSPTHDYAAGGTYRVTLTVTDEHGGSATHATDVEVADEDCERIHQDPQEQGRRREAPRDGFDQDLAGGDVDEDGVADHDDICPNAADPGQEDFDLDGKGDACDPDADADLAPDGADNCLLLANPDQADRNADREGDSCDDDLDGDEVDNAFDNCPALANPDQADVDGNNVGDACLPIADKVGKIAASRGEASRKAVSVPVGTQVAPSTPALAGLGIGGVLLLAALAFVMVRAGRR
jgi:PKD repeat protein